MTIDLTAQGFQKGSTVTKIISAPITLTFSKAGGQSTPTYYVKSPTGVRLYSKNTLTVDAGEGNTISKVKFTFTVSKTKASDLQANTGNFDSSAKEWTGEAQSIIITNTANSGNAGFTKIIVTYKASEAPSPKTNAPKISGEEYFSSNTTVSITADDNADIYFTKDGSNPTNQSEKYTSPFIVDETTTIKAIAYENDIPSSITERTFTKIKEGENRITFKASIDKTSSAGDLSLEKNGIVINLSKGALNRDDNYRVYKNEDITISTNAGYLTKVEFKCDAPNKEDYGPGNFNNATTGTYTYKDSVGTWEGESSSFTLTAQDSQVRINEIDITFVATETINADISPAGYATYVTTKDADFDKTENVKAYTAEYNNTEHIITLHEIHSAPMNTPVILKGKAGNYYFVVPTTTPTTITDNDLKASDTDITCDGTQWILVEKDKGVGFGKATSGTTLKAGKAYLVITDQGAAAQNFLGFADETTGISSAAVETELANGKAYNLAGQRVGKEYKGIVIMNGKKYIRK